MSRYMTGLALMLLSSMISAGEVDVIAARAQPGNDGSWRFQVTLKHADEGWEHYADRWEILDARGHIIATRILAHPHVDEQPFTRGLSGVKIPEGTGSLIIRGHDKKHGYGGRTLELSWPPEK
ncbi:hypothetical protein [Thiolapillus brandeum]|uniref:Uncharacterized protein n=1 Tax=Thiolapillus brandeum TaxID=1076588 RepID=A0A7U6JIS2_9GAMM|nr:hypothetical protein [Thiolapillus brandeum]BAO44530.1 conserved hypothetical protein [Thiolapillus brandeum]